MQSQERGATQVVGQPIILSDAETGVAVPPPTLGQHTREVLSEIGYSDDDISQLADSGAT